MHLTQTDEKQYLDTLSLHGQRFALCADAALEALRPQIRKELVQEFSRAFRWTGDTARELTEHGQEDLLLYLTRPCYTPGHGESTYLAYLEKTLLPRVRKDVLVSAAFVAVRRQRDMVSRTYEGRQRDMVSRTYEDHGGFFLRLLQADGSSKASDALSDVRALIDFLDCGQTRLHTMLLDLLD